MRAFQVGDWLVRPDLNVICRGDTEVHLEPKAMTLLVTLAERGGQVVSRSELLRDVWAGTFVADGAVFRVLSELRRALDDDARDPRYIRTVPRRGYVLIAPVSFPEPAPVARPAAVSSSRDVPDRRQAQRRWVAWASIAAAAALMAIGIWASRPETTGLAPARPGPAAPDAFAVGQVWEDRADCSSYARAIAAYEVAVVDAPAHVDTRIHLIDSYLASAVIGCVPRSVAASEIQDALAAVGEANGSRDVARRRASARLWLDADLDGARRLFDALPAQADVSRAALYLTLDAPDQAIAEARRALDDAPAELGENFTLGAVLLLAGRPREAAAQFSATLAIYPDFPPALSLEALAHLEAGDSEAAAATARRAAASLRPPLDRFSSLPGLILARLKLSAEARDFNARWQTFASAAPWVAPTAHAVASLAAGDDDAARRWMALAREAHDPWLLLSATDPVLRRFMISSGP